MFKTQTFIFTALLSISISAVAQNPVPLVGNACPGGTHRSGDYCIPNTSTSDEVIIQKTGKHECNLAEFALTRDMIEQRFAFYTSDKRWPIWD